MTAEQSGEGISKGERPSPAVEAVLALIIERPDYSYKLWQRYEDRFFDLHPISKARVYQIVDHLVAHGLAEPMPAEGPSGRQPRVPYRATAEGARAYRTWLAEGLHVDPRRQELLLRLLATGARDARMMLQIIDTYERETLASVARSRGARDSDRSLDLRESLIEEEARLQLEVQMRFIAFARARIQDDEEEG